MNQRNSVLLATRRISRWLLTKALLAVFVLLGSSALAQISYTQDFTGCAASPCNNWSVVGGFSASITSVDNTGYTPCTAGNPAIRTNLYLTDEITAITSTASLGTSNGALATFSFNYKVVDYPDGATTPAGEAQFTVSYSEVSATGPWTPIGSSFTNAATGTCISSPAFTFTPNAAQPVFILIDAVNLLPDEEFNGFWLVVDDISLTQAAGSDCIGTPDPGATTGPALACSGASFLLGLENATSGDGVSYQWYSSTTSAGGPWAPVGANLPTYSPSQTVPSWYYCTVTCGPSGFSGDSDVLAVGMNGYLACYCSNINYTFDTEPICLVQFANINNASSPDVNASPDLEDFTSITGNINAGQNYVITLTGNTAGNWTNFFTVFFDFDQNGIFETSFPIGSIANDECLTQLTGNIFIPTLAPAGISRMRVVKNFNASPTDPCGTYGFGQAEDYLVNVTAADVCDEVPAPGNTLSTVAAACDGENFTLSLQNTVAGIDITYQWQYDIGGGYVDFGGDASTQVTNQSVATTYRCIVTCPATTSTPSNPISIGMTAALPVAFDSPTPFPSNCWTMAQDAAGSLFHSAIANGYAVPGSGSAEFFFYLTNAGNTMSLTSPALTPMPANYQIRFDVSGTTYTGGEVDQIVLETSSSGPAGPWTPVVTMDNNATTGVLNTINNGLPGTTTANYGATAPTAAQWVTLFYPVPTGTNAVRFVGTSGFGNNVYIDNINFEAIPTCFAPTLASLTATLATTTTANIAWGAQGTAVTYDVEVRQGGSPGTGGETFAGNTASTSIVATGLTFGQTYDVYVRSQCGVDGTSTWTGPRTLFMGYCLAGGDNTLGLNPQVDNVQVAGINAGNPSPSTTLGYVDLTANVGFMAPGGTYSFYGHTVVNWQDTQFLVWVDWNNDIDFDDAGETLLVGAPGTYATGFNGSVSCPLGTSAGNKRMRVRWQYNDVTEGAFPNLTPCGNATFSQVLDFTINVCGAPEAAIAINDQCGSNEFFVNVTTSSFGSGGGATINYSIDGVAQTGVAATLGMVPLGPFTPGQRITVSLDNGTLCPLNMGDWYSNCPVTVVCSPPTNYEYTHCYRQGDTRTWTFTNSSLVGETTTLTFTAGTIAVGDVLSVYDGTDNSTLLASFSGVGTPFDMATAGSVTSVATQSLFMTFTQSTSADNCFAGTPGFVPLAFNVECTPGCNDPIGSAIATTNCSPQGFTVTVSVTSTETNGPVNVAYTVDAVPQTPISVAPGNNTILGPFAYGTLVTNVRLIHEYDPICDLPLGNFSPANTCPPGNDDCAGATVLTVQPAGGCLWTGATLRTTANATYSTPAATCGATGVSPVLRDVWFTFNTGTSLAPFYLYYDQGTATNLTLELYTGTCGALSSAFCGAAQDLVLNAPGLNTQWYARFLSNSTTGTSGTFRYCLTASTTCVGVVSTATVTPANQTATSAQVTWASLTAGNYILEYGPSTTFTTPGAGATAGTNGTIVTASTTGTTAVFNLNCLNPATNYRMFIRRNCGAGDFSVNSPFRGNVGLTTLAAPPAASAIVPATCAQAAAIPDAGCAANNTLNRSFTASPGGTQLNVDVSLESVDLIISHLSKGQLRVRLVSPQGCEYPLILARGGTADHFGDPAACPAGVFKLKDGAPAVSTISTVTNSLTGTFAPEQPLAAITGNPNGTWHIRICDGTAATTGTLEYVKLNFLTCAAPTVSAITHTNNCTAGTYSLSGTISSLGSATSISVVGSVSGTIATLVAPGPWGPSAPLPFATTQTITYVHNLDVACNLSAGTYPQTTAPCFPNNMCLTPGLLVPDNTCPTGVTGTVSISGQPNSLGGNVILESVDLILTGTFKGDNQISLTSPNGATVALITNRGGSGDNFGDMTLCPNGNFRLQAGFPSVSTITSSPVTTTGTFAPEQPFTGFNDLSNPNGNWTIRACDNATGDQQSLRYLKLNFVVPPCFPPTVTAPVIVPNPSCNGTYTVTFNVTSTGSSPGGVINITNTGGAPALNAQGTGAKVVGPFTYGAPVSITLVHGSDVACNVALGPFNPTNPCVGNGSCAAPLPVAIPDGPTGSVAVLIPISHPSTVLGTSPTNAFLESVDIKVTHTWRGDVRATLTSPGGQTFTLINQRQNANDNGNNLGDGAQACPNGVMKFKDGAPSMAPGWTANTDNVAIGSWAPEQPLSGFTGNPNGNWTLTLFDLANIDTGSLTYIKLNFQTIDCLGVPDGTTVPGSSCSAGPGSTIGTYSASCVCSSIACPTENLNIAYTKDASAATWTIYEQGTNAPMQTGSFLGNAGNVQTCVPDGCYYLRVTDNVGDGIGGGYILSLLSGGTRIVDNRNNFLNGLNSQQAGPGFCLPLSADRLIFTSCDKMDWRTNEYIYATDNPTVTAVWNNFGAGTTQRANSGYEMWWFDPTNNAGYTFRRFQSHATTNGLSASATRACGFKINSWSGNQLAQGVLYNVRVRARLYNVALNENQWGAACRFGRDEVRAECPLTKLLDTPGATANQFSCGASRAIGTGAANLVHARPVTRYLAGVSTAANRYKFRFVTDAGGTTIIKISATGQSWVNTAGLSPCKTYDVDVTASFNNGTSYCEAYAGTAFGQPYAPKWGEVCTLNTLGCPSGNGGNQNMAVDGSTNAAGLRMYPNPNRGDQVMLSLDAVEEGVNTVSVDIYDVFGKRVDARTIAVQDNFLNTTIDLNGALAAGMYTVNITAGAITYTERLVIQP